MKAVGSVVVFRQKKDAGCKSVKTFPCQHCGQPVREKDIIVFAGYEICPHCQVNCREMK
jgi:2-keto-3-deoxy-6-phosphogluconate aldolase